MTHAAPNVVFAFVNSCCWLAASSGTSTCLQYVAEYHNNEHAQHTGETTKAASLTARMPDTVTVCKGQHLRAETGKSYSLKLLLKRCLAH